MAPVMWVCFFFFFFFFVLYLFVVFSIYSNKLCVFSKKSDEYSYKGSFSWSW